MNPAPELAPAPVVPQDRPAPKVVDPAPAVAEKAAVDLNDPMRRYQWITVSRVNGVQKAFIKDLLRDCRKLMARPTDLASQRRSLRMHLKPGRAGSAA